MLFVFKRHANEVYCRPEPGERIPVYAVDDQTVSISPGDGRPEIGLISQTIHPGDVVAGLRVQPDECVVAVPETWV